MRREEGEVSKSSSAESEASVRNLHVVSNDICTHVFSSERQFQLDWMRA